MIFEFRTRGRVWLVSMCILMFFLGLMILSDSMRKIAEASYQIVLHVPPIELHPTTGGGGSRFGSDCSGIPDVNGDGHADALVGQRLGEELVPQHAGRAYIFDGMTGDLLRTLISPNEIPVTSRSPSIPTSPSISVSIKTSIVLAEYETPAANTVRIVNASTP